MSFNSFDYFCLLSASFIMFWGLRRWPSLRLWALLFASYWFYTAWNGIYVLLILVSTLIDYCAGALIYAYEGRPKLRKFFLVVSILSNLAILGVFKYGQFAIENVQLVADFLQFDADLPTMRLLLPIGVSFYTFQSMSYTFDIYLGKIRPARSIRDFFLFVAFFPQLVAGPVVRARELLPQFEKTPKLNSNDLAEGVYRILRGLIKKMVIADYLSAALVDPVFNMPHLYNSTEMLIAVIGFQFQIYCDFSGYTDIALGSARLFGYQLPENFLRPFAAHTPGVFWRRWHITLTRFISDYVYIPLGGGRSGEWRAYRNVFFVFATIGLWHGAAWKYVFFGIYHAAGVIATRWILGVLSARSTLEPPEVERNLQGRAIPVLLTNVFVLLSLPLFRAEDLSAAWTVYVSLFSFNGWSIGLSGAALGLLAATIVSHYIPEDWESKLPRTFSTAPALAQGAAVAGLAVAIHHMALLAKRSFIYFQF